MSWFDSSGFSSFAKTALSQAQKSIDRVLDIEQDETNSAASKSSGNFILSYLFDKFAYTLYTVVGALKLGPNAILDWGSERLRTCMMIILRYIITFGR